MKLIYLIGEPGVGKTTTMAALTEHLTVMGVLARPHRTLLGCRRGLIRAVEMGKRRREFGGTDSLPMDAVVGAEHYITSGQAAAETELLLAEGARLANRRFLAAAVTAGWQTHLVHLHAPREAARRRRLRGAHQNPTWVQGAATRAHRLAQQPPDRVLVHNVNTEPPPPEVAAAVASATQFALTDTTGAHTGHG